MLIEWRQRHMGPGGKKRRSPAPGIEVHHTGADSTAELGQLMRSMRRYHVEQQGMADVFYSFVIAPNGDYAEGRGWARGNGSTLAVPVAFVGDFDADEPTPEAKLTFHLLRLTALRAGWVRTNVGWHRQRANSDCPGDGTIRWIESGLDNPLVG